MQQAQQKASILLVDDYVDSREMYAEALSYNGYDVTVAGDGEEAIEKAVAGRFDLIILDLALPKLDGVSVIKALRARPETAKVPIITLSATVGEGQHAAVLAAGGDVALDKPCLPDELEDVVRAYIRRGRDAS